MPNPMALAGTLAQGFAQAANGGQSPPSDDAPVNTPMPSDSCPKCGASLTPAQEAYYGDATGGVDSKAQAEMNLDPSVMAPTGHPAQLSQMELDAAKSAPTIRAK